MSSHLRIPLPCFTLVQHAKLLSYTLLHLEKEKSLRLLTDTLPTRIILPPSHHQHECVFHVMIICFRSVVEPREVQEDTAKLDQERRWRRLRESVAGNLELIESVRDFVK